MTADAAALPAVRVAGDRRGGDRRGRRLAALRLDHDGTEDAALRAGVRRLPRRRGRGRGRQLGDGRTAPGGRGARHRARRRGDHDHAHVHGDRRGGALHGRAPGVRRHRSRHVLHRVRTRRGGDHAADPGTHAGPLRGIPVRHAGADGSSPREPAIDIVEDAAHALPTPSDGRLVGTVAECGDGVQLLRDQDHRDRRGRHAGDEAARDRAARPHHATARHRPRRVRSLHGEEAELVLRGRRARLQVQHDRSRRRSACTSWPRPMRSCRRRAAIAARYDEALEGLPLVLPPRPGSNAEAMRGISTSCALPTACDSGATRSCRRCTTPASAAACTTCRCTSSRTGAIPTDLDARQFPNSQLLYERGFSLPIYTRMTESDQQRVIDALRSILGRT